MTRRVLLLEEHRFIGGITTIANTLCTLLESAGWTVRRCALNECRWRQLAAIAARSDVILATNNFKPAYIAWALGSLLKIRVVVWVHGPLRDVLAQARPSPLKRLWLRWLYRRLSSIVFVSKSSLASFESWMGPHLDPRQRRAVISNAVKTSGTPVEPRKFCGTDFTELAYVGRVSPEKRPELLLDMLRLLPVRFRLTIIGDGPLSNKLRHDGTDLIGVGRLFLWGARPPSAELYRHCDLTLLSSQYEGCPMSILEALAMGVPCVAVPIAATRELLGTDAPKLLASDESASALADAVNRICETDREELTQSMQRVLARHTEAEFMARWQAELERAGPA